MGHTFSRILLHAAFSTKERRQWLYADMRPQLLAYLHGIAKRKDIALITSNAVDDHIHVLFAQLPTQSPSEIINVLKSNTSKWVHETYPDLAAFAWQNGYGIFSVSESNCDAVIRYIQDQEAHHHRLSWAEEYKQFLEKHGVEFHPEHYLD